MLTVTVIIPTYKRGDLLARGLDGLTLQTLPRERFHVLVVDDGSPDSPDAVVAAVADRLNIELLKKPNTGLAATRNHGAARARGDLLLFMDDDILPCPEYLAEHVRVHAENRRAVALGSLPHPPDLPVTPFLYYLNRVVHYDLFLRYGAAENIPLPPLNGNSSIRRSEFEAAGGYDTSFATYGGEDTEMGYRLLSRGLQFVYAPGARGYHYHVKGFAAYQRDMYSSGAAIVAIVRKYPQVRSRVNLDIITAAWSTLPWSKRAQRLILRTLELQPSLRRALEWLITKIEPLGWNRVLYPFYLVAGHAHYAAGMRQELGRGQALDEPPGRA